MMGLKIKLTRKKLKEHFRYFAWAYIVVLVATGTIFSTVITSIKNQSPAEQQLITCVCGDYISSAYLNVFCEEIEEAFPDMKVISCENLPYNVMSTMAQTYKQKFLSYISNKLGDVMILPYTEFTDLAKYGTFEPLDDYFQDYIATLDPIDLKTVQMDCVDDEVHVYGIPLNELEFFPYYYDTNDKVLVVTAYSKNKENAIKLARWFINYMIETDWYGQKITETKGE